MPTDLQIPYWAAGLYALLGAAGIVVGGGVVAADPLARRSARGIWPGLGAGFLIALGALGALPDACESIGVVHGTALALATFAAVLIAHRAGHGGAAAHAGGHTHGTPASVAPGAHAGLSLHDARLAVAGLALHALLDGVAVSAALAGMHGFGLVVAFFIVLHKIPEGAAAAALTHASGGDAARVRRGVLLVAAASLLGGLAIFAALPYLGYALAVTAGVTAGVGVGIASHLLGHDRRNAVIGLLLGAGLFAVGEFMHAA